MAYAGDHLVAFASPSPPPPRAPRRERHSIAPVAVAPVDIEYSHAIGMRADHGGMARPAWWP